VVKLLGQDLHILTGAYALDAFDGAERDRFDPACGGRLRETATRLALAVAVVPPPALRGRVLAAAAPDARIMKQPISAGGVATVVVSAARHDVIFSTAGLLGLPSAKVCEPWVMGLPGSRAAGLLAAGAGRTTPVPASGLRCATRSKRISGRRRSSRPCSAAATGSA
jgi:hypothetical protein